MVKKSIILCGGLGDTVFAVPALKCNADIVVFANEANKNLLGYFDVKNEIFTVNVKLGKSALIGKIYQVFKLYCVLIYHGKGNYLIPTFKQLPSLFHVRIITFKDGDRSLNRRIIMKRYLI